MYQKQVENSDAAYLLKSLELVSMALIKNKDIDQTIDDVLETVLSIFNSDRIWLFYPCDPDAKTFRVLAEKNKPEYPGAFTSGQELPITPEASETIKKALTLGSPTVFDPKSGNKVDDVASKFSVLSQIIMAVHPRIGKPWMFGMHQCSHARVWTKNEQMLFKKISFRVVESLNNLILLKDLKKSEQNWKRTEESLRQSESRYRNLLENLPQKIFHKDINSIYLSCNKNFAGDLKIEPDKITGTTDYDYFPRELAQKYINDDKRIIKSKETEEIVEKYIVDDREFWVNTVKTPVMDEKGVVSGVLGIFWDITELKRAEEEKKRLELQLRQAHKMEAIGTLAGGIAHDFNNILAAILGYAEMAIDDIPDYSLAKYQIEQVIKAGNRARDLVKQILAFSRQETKERIPIKIHLVISEAIKLLRASIPTSVEIKQNIDVDCGNIMANSTQIHQVLINICTNASQAMEEKGGILEINLDSLYLSNKELANNQNLKPGIYVKLSIKDTGEGINPDIIDRIFDPYFTTKEVGKGSGMGLAVVLGIVNSHKGMISVESQPGKGTEFNVFFPKILDELQHDTGETESLLTGNERILVIDDEEMIVDMTKQRLERLGYQVTAVTDSIAALELVRSRPDEFDLIITDQTMPGMTGKQMAQELIAIKPDILIILCTGYSSKIDAEKAKETGIKAFLMKPVRQKELAETIRLILDGRESAF